MATVDPELDKDAYKATEVCRIANVAPYVLRYWQSEFPFLAEGKEKGANRTYSAREVRVIARVRQLLYEEGFTIAGAKKKVEAEISSGVFDGRAPKEEAAPAARPAAGKPAAPKAAAAPAPAAPARPSADVQRVVTELKDILKILDRPRGRV